MQAFEQSGESVGLGRRDLGDEPGEPFAQRGLGGAKGRAAFLREGDGLSAPIIIQTAPGEHARVLECGEELGDRRRGDGRATGEPGADDLAVGDRLQGQVLGNREGRVVCGEQSLDPAADQRRRANQRLCGLPAVGVMSPPWQ